MKAVELQTTTGLGGLVMVDRPAPTPADNDIVIRVSAASLNYRDLVIATGAYASMTLPVIPLSDGVGEVVDVGANVTRFRVGDRVCPHYVVDWHQGPAAPEVVARRLGGPDDGVLCEFFCGDEAGFVRAPTHLTDAECATLPIAGLTAWQALFVQGDVRPGDWVVVQGTGGVSIFALQLAKAAGARVIVTSSRDEKLKRAASLGADVCINYRDVAWDEAVREVTGGRGADHVIEVVGGENLARSVAATRMAGQVSLIGFLEDSVGQIDLRDALRLTVTLSGISVGNRASFEALVDACEANDLHPVVDEVFPFSDYLAAYSALQDAGHFGKLVIDVQG